jgi:hypothetical protein
VKCVSWAAEPLKAFDSSPSYVRRETEVLDRRRVRGLK